jgi:3-oxoacyl-[acyl-carrier protein] reductase
MNFNFQNYTVIVTGGTRGIGKSISEVFLKFGATVIATYSADKKSAELLLEKHSNLPLEIVQFDISDYNQVEAFYDNFDKKYNKLDVLVNNAGIRKDSIVGLMPYNDWQKVIDTNLTGTYSMSKLGMMRMVPNRFGRIITITSPSGKLGFPGQANYAAAKAGQVAFTKTLSKEVARYNITANCISPGFIETDLISDLTEEQKKAYRQQIPMRRFGKPEDISPAVAFLASTEAGYINGTVLDITGGI